MVLLIIIPMKNGYYWEYTLFSDKAIYKNIENIWGNIWTKTWIKTVQSPCFIFVLSCFHSLRSWNIASEVFDFHDFYRGSSHSNTMLDYWRDPEGKDLHFFTSQTTSDFSRALEHGPGDRAVVGKLAQWIPAEVSLAARLPYTWCSLESGNIMKYLQLVSQNLKSWLTKANTTVQMY